ARNTSDKFYCALSQLPSRYPSQPRTCMMLCSGREESALKWAAVCVAFLFDIHHFIGKLSVNFPFCPDGFAACGKERPWRKHCVDTAPGHEACACPMPPPPPGASRRVSAPSPGPSRNGAADCPHHPTPDRGRAPGGRGPPPVRVLP